MKETIKESSFYNLSYGNYNATTRDSLRWLSDHGLMIDGQGEKIGIKALVLWRDATPSEWREKEKNCELYELKSWHGKVPEFGEITIKCKADELIEEENKLKLEEMKKEADESEIRRKELDEKMNTLYKIRNLYPGKRINIKINGQEIKGVVVKNDTEDLSDEYKIKIKIKGNERTIKATRYERFPTNEFDWAWA